LLAAKEISVVQTSQRRNAGRETAGNLANVGLAVVGRFRNSGE
jgi:hypothetical protein